MLHRRSIRLKNYDYSREGAYFITICTHCRQELFGQIIDAKMRLNEIGDAVKECWLAIPEHYPNVTLDEWVIMPDHIHGIIVIEMSVVGVQNVEPLPQTFQNLESLTNDQNVEPLPQAFQNVELLSTERERV